MKNGYINVYYRKRKRSTHMRCSNKDFFQKRKFQFINQVPLHDLVLLSRENIEIKMDFKVIVRNRKILLIENI